jgi:2-oxoglutarate ferredoxin oxidoreductase subunit alpha
MWQSEQLEDAELVVAAFGIHGRMCQDLVTKMRAKGKKVGFIRPITLWPFPDKAFAALPDSVKNILVVEMNHGQMVEDVRLAVNGRMPVHFLGKTGGDMPMNTLAEMIAEADRILGE